MSPLPDAPVTVLFTPAELPLFRDGMAGLHPLPPSFLDRPCWLHRAGLHGDGAIFAAPPEGPVDPAVHPHFWAMLSDVTHAMCDDAPLRRRVLDAEGHGRVVVGYHATGDYASVRDHFRARGAVVEARELADAPTVVRAPEEVETLRAVDALFPLGPRAPAPRRALRDHLHGLGRAPPALSTRAARELAGLFQGLSPRALNGVLLRALDALATNPPRAVELEWRLRFDSPAHDLHGAWRALLRARGIDDDALLPTALAAWTAGPQLNSRAWWVLDRAARDPAATLARVRRSPWRADIHRRLLFASAITWRLPRFRLLAEELLARHARRLDALAVTQLLAGDAARPLRLSIVARRAEIVRGRAPRERAALLTAFDEVYEREGDPFG